MAPVSGTRCVCYCASCQAFLRHLDRYDLADGQGGTDLFQTDPDKVTFTKGSEHLRALRLTDKGPIRWYAECCGTPVCNTGAKRIVPLASFLVQFFDDPAKAGAVVGRVNLKDATGHVDGETGGMGRLIRAFIARALASLITGRYRQTPFFDASGRPVAEVKRLSEEEKKAAYPG